MIFLKIYGLALVLLASGFFPKSHAEEAKIPKKAVKQFYGKKTGVELSKARPEDITSENYPEVIESFVFPDAELKDVIKAMSTDLNINIIMSPEIASKKISIISYSPITVAEAYQAFLSALSIHNLTIIRSGSFLKVIPIDSALKSNSSVHSGRGRLNTDQFLTRIIKPKHIDVAELEKKIKPLVDSKTVKSMVFYPPSNMIIITDYSLNVEKVRKIIETLDVPSQDNVFKVIPIKHAEAEKLTKIIGGLLSGMSGGGSSFYRGRRAGTDTRFSIKKSNINIHSLSHDERTNAIIVMGNQAGIRQVESLIKQLDYYTDPELAGGIFVYKVKHGTAEELSKTLNEVLGHSSRAGGAKGKPPTAVPRVGIALRNLRNTVTAKAFQDVRIIAEKNTNSLLIVSNKYNYETILNILKKVDISRNQVFVKTIIMELSTDRSQDWQIANYFFPRGGGGISRVGYGINSLEDLFSKEGAMLMFPLSLIFKAKSLSLNDLNKSAVTEPRTNISQFLNFGREKAGTYNIPSLTSFIKFLQKTVGGNILSTPQVIALDHQEAKVVIEDRIPVVGSLTHFAASGGANIPNVSTKHETITTQLVITPHINPDVDSVRLKIKQNIDSIVDSARVPAQLQGSSIGVKKREIETSITLKNKETAVLGGLTRASNNSTISKIPLLGDLPFVGWLFRNSKRERQQSNLIVFITPEIIHSAEEHKNILSKKLKERMHFIRKFSGNKDPYQETTDNMLSQKTLVQAPSAPPVQEEMEEIDEDDFFEQEPPIAPEEETEKPSPTEEPPIEESPMEESLTDPLLETAPMEESPIETAPADSLLEEPAENINIE